MATETADQRASWVPITIILLAQVQLGFNVNALVISMGAIVEDLGTTADMVGTALVAYSLAVAGLVMLGATIGSATGSRRAFQIGIAVQGVAMILMALSTSTSMMIAAQAIAGVAAALAVPAFVVLIAAHYRGTQQQQSLGLLAAAVPMSGMLAFMFVGLLSVVISWRWTFALLGALAIVNVALSFRLMELPKQEDAEIDLVGAAVAAIAITIISVGFNNVNNWGLLVANSNAPFNVLGLSPTLILIIAGIVLCQFLFKWLRSRRESGKSTLFAPEIVGRRAERSAAIALLIIGALGAAVNFLIPLYIQIVQGRTTLQTAVAIVPYSVAILVTATLVVRLYQRFTPRQIGQFGFVAAAIGLVLLAIVIRNDWGTPLVITSLIVIGIGEGVLITLLFNVLVSASPKEFAGQVGALRGTVNNLATGLGTAIASVLAIATLSIFVSRAVVDHPILAPPVAQYLQLDDINFIRNDELAALLDQSSATPDVIDSAIAVNTDARLKSLKISFLVLGGLALLGIVPASGLPPYVPGEVPSTQVVDQPVIDERTRVLAARKA